MGFGVRNNLGGAGNDPGSRARWISMESSWRVAIPNNASHPDCVGYGRLWCFVFGRVGFGFAALCRGEDSQPGERAIGLDGGNHVVGADGRNRIRFRGLSRVACAGAGTHRDRKSVV